MQQTCCYDFTITQLYLCPSRGGSSQ